MPKNIFLSKNWGGAQGRDSLKSENFSNRTYTKKRPKKDLTKTLYTCSEKRPTSGRTQNETVRESTHIWLKVIETSIHIFDNVDSHKLTKWNILWVYIVESKISETLKKDFKQRLDSTKDLCRVLSSTKDLKSCFKTGLLRSSFKVLERLQKFAYSTRPRVLL